MCYIIITSVQAKYDLVNTYDVQYCFLGNHRYSFENIFESFRSIIPMENFYMDWFNGDSDMRYHSYLLKNHARFHQNAC